MEQINACRACGSEHLIEFLDLGKQYLSDFRNDESKPPEYPLVALFCDNCKLVQLKHTTPQSEMYHANYGFKSGISSSIKEDLNDVVCEGLELMPNTKKWLDIASNDGTLLSFVPNHIYRVGVDPISLLCEQAKFHANMIHNAFFDRRLLVKAYFETGEAEYEKFDVVTSVSCFYDMPDPNKFVSDVKSVLAKDGVWIIQQNYLLTTMELSAVDNFCHEHLEYYTLLALENLLEKHDLEVIDVKLSMVNGGSIRTVVAHKGSRVPNISVQRQRDKEDAFSLQNIEPYEEFASKVLNELIKLRSLVEEKVNNGDKVFILAASTRGATIWQAAGIDFRLVGCAVERNPAKVGKWFSALGVPIISEAEARRLKPDYMIVGPWFFAKEIINREQQYVKDGGKLIIPLPRVKIVDR